MVFSVGLVFVGAMLIVAGWNNVSFAAAAKGDNTQPKSAITGGPNASAPASSSSSSGSGGSGSGSGSSPGSGYSQGSGANVH
jgi:hypothetical protein